MTVSVCQPSKCVRRSPMSIYGNRGTEDGSAGPVLHVGQDPRQCTMI